ncbi:MAG: PspA/IM30 family protein [Pontiellaceae bacterium]|nr:PspA/IM30 family protein [Pontiellaceae bacterium]MBN2785219.1 PspA/IM30 family protein [Pontiellaceae bacterium]
MNLFKRMMRITNARIEAVLSSVEDPETMFPQLVREMEEQVGKATEAEAQALTALKVAERNLEGAKNNVAKMQSGAELAVKNNDEAMAREAIAAQLDHEKTLQLKADACDKARESYERARDTRLQVQEKLDEIRSKQDEILTRARIAKSQKKIEQTVSSPLNSSDSILDAIDRLEGKVEQAEAELEVRREVAGSGKPARDLEKRLEKLESEQEVEQRLAALKNKLAD